MPKFELQRGHKRFLGISALVLVGSSAGGWFTWKSWKSLEEEETNLQTQITASRNKIRGIEDLERDVIVLRENLEYYVRILPSDGEVNELYRNIQDFVNFSGVQITELNPQPQRNKMTTSEVFDRAEYKIRFDATFAQLLQFINRIENHERFVRITDITMKASRRDDEEQGDPRHDVNLSVETFVYKGNEVGPGVNIAGYDRKRAQLAEQVVEARHDFALDRFQLLAEGVRRDPMVDPRVRISEDSVGLADLTEQREFLEEIQGQIEECHALFDLMDAAGSVMREMELRVEAIGLLTEVQVRADDAKAEKFISAPSLQREFERVLVELDRLRQRAGDAAVTERPDEELIRVSSALAQMSQAFELGDYQACVDTFDIVSSLSTGSTNPEVTAALAEMENIYLVATTALAFMDLDLEVSGLVMYPQDGSGQESVAIVNNMVYREGEAVADDLFLTQINVDGLVFEFRGVPLTYDY